MRLRPAVVAQVVGTGGNDGGQAGWPQCDGVTRYGEACIGVGGTPRCDTELSNRGMLVDYMLFFEVGLTEFLGGAIPQADRHWQKEHPAGKACVADISRSNVTEKEAANDQCQASSPNRYSEYNLFRTHMPSASNAFQAKVFGELTRGIWRANLDEGGGYCSMSQFAYIFKAEKFSKKQAPSPSSLGLHRFFDTCGDDFTDLPIPGIGPAIILYTAPTRSQRSFLRARH